MQKIFGACYHPVYGGWISLDGVFIFKDVLCPALPKKDPEDVFPNREKRIELLNKYNTPPHSFRDLLPVPRRYAEEHIVYLSSDLDQMIAIAKQIQVHVHSTMRHQEDQRMACNIDDEYSKYSKTRRKQCFLSELKSNRTRL